MTSKTIRGLVGDNNQIIADQIKSNDFPSNFGTLELTE